MTIALNYYKRSATHPTAVEVMAGVGTKWSLTTTPQKIADLDKDRSGGYVLNLSTQRVYLGITSAVGATTADADTLWWIDEGQSFWFEDPMGNVLYSDIYAVVAIGTADITVIVTTTGS